MLWGLFFKLRTFKHINGLSTTIAKRNWGINEVHIHVISALSVIFIGGMLQTSSTYWVEHKDTFCICQLFELYRYTLFLPSFHFGKFDVWTFAKHIKIHFARALVRNAYGQLLLHSVCFTCYECFDKQKHRFLSVTQKRKTVLNLKVNWLWKSKYLHFLSQLKIPTMGGLQKISFKVLEKAQIIDFDFSLFIVE